MGAVLAHRDADDQVRPIAFASRRLAPMEQSYIQPDKEAVALVYGAERLHQYLWGRRFEPITDNKPLAGLLAADESILLQAFPRIIRWKKTEEKQNKKMVLLFFLTLL